MWFSLTSVGFESLLFQVCLTCHNQWTLLLWSLLQGVCYSCGLIMKGFIKGSPCRKNLKGRRESWKWRGKVLFDHFDNNICHALKMTISFNQTKCWSVPNVMAPAFPSHPKNVYICTCTLIFFPLLQQKHGEITAGEKNTMSDQSWKTKPDATFTFMVAPIYLHVGEVVKLLGFCTVISLTLRNLWELQNTWYIIG